MSIVDCNGDPLIIGANVRFRGSTGRFKRFVGSPSPSEDSPESGHVEIKTDEDVCVFPTFSDGAADFCPDVEVVIEKVVEILDRFPNGHPRKCSVRDSRSVSAVVALRSGGTWEPLHAVLPDGQVRDLPQCYALSQECLSALEEAS